MTLPTWPIYIQLQTAYAYGESGVEVNPDNEATNRSAVEYAQRLEAVRNAERTLIIGPGGISEVEAFRKKTTGQMFVLSAFPPEVSEISAKCPGVMAEVGDMHDMPYQSGAFGFLHASNVLEHALAPYIALTECRRVLREGGCANFVLPSFEGKEGGRGPFHLHCLTRDVWIELLHKTGLQVADTWHQQGIADPSGHYVHYRCVAVTPPHPHDKILKEVITYKASR